MRSMQDHILTRFLKRVIPAKRTGYAAESRQWKTRCHRIRSKGPWQPRWSSSPCILLGWSQRRATRLTRTTASEAHNQREDKEMEETEENRGSNGGSNLHAEDNVLQDGNISGPGWRSETGTY